MTATSVLAPSAVARSWTAVQRAIVMLFVVVVFAAAAFGIGRATAPAHHTSPAITPAAVSVPSASAAPAVACRAGHPC